MTTLQLQQIKEKILEQTISLENEITYLQEKLEPITPECCLDDLTRFEMMHEQDIFHQTLENAQLRLSKLNYLFHSIDSNPNYGLCSECMDAIVFERLLLLPETRYCIHCAL